MNGEVSDFLDQLRNQVSPYCENVKQNIWRLTNRVILHTPAIRITQPAETFATRETNIFAPPIVRRNAHFYENQRKKEKEERERKYDARYVRASAGRALGTCNSYSLTLSRERVQEKRRNIFSDYSVETSQISFSRP